METAEKQSSTVCVPCKTRVQTYNAPLWGWNSKGLVKVNNYCCAVCGSNGLVFDVKEAAHA